MDYPGLWPQLSLSLSVFASLMPFLPERRGKKQCWSIWLFLGVMIFVFVLCMRGG